MPPASLPNILDILRRTATLASERQSQQARTSADLLLTLHVENYKLTDFDRFDAIVDAGYRQAVRILERQALP